MGIPYSLKRACQNLESWKVVPYKSIQNETHMKHHETIFKLKETTTIMETPIGSDSGCSSWGASLNITPRNPIPTTSALTQETSAWLSLSHQTSEVSIGFRHNKSRTQSFHLTLRCCIKLSGLSCTGHAWCEVYFCPLAAEENDGEVPRSMMPMPQCRANRCVLSRTGKNVQEHHGTSIGLRFRHAGRQVLRDQPDQPHLPTTSDDVSTHATLKAPSMAGLSSRNCQVMNFVDTLWWTNIAMENCHL